MAFDFFGDQQLLEQTVMFSEGPLLAGWEGDLKDFLGLKFWTKDIFWVYERQVNFLGRKKKQGLFWELRFSSAQIINNISAVHCWCLGSQVLKLGFFGGIKYEPLLDSLLLPPHPLPPPPTSSLNYLSWAPGDLLCMYNLLIK